MVTIDLTSHGKMDGGYLRVVSVLRFHLEDGPIKNSKKLEERLNAYIHKINKQPFNTSKRNIKITVCHSPYYPLTN
jgi:hypothetical protein